MGDIYSARVRDLWETDVLVIGSGSAGASAALAAAQAGARVTLIERYGFMGGISTQVLDTFYGFFTPGSVAKKVVGGVPDQVVDALKMQSKAIYRPNTYGAGMGITYDPETLKIVWETLALGAGVRLLYHTFVVDVVCDGDRITGVIAATKSGFVRIRAHVVIDASGDADVAAAAGAPFEDAKSGAVQSLTTTFQLINVDMPRAIAVKKDQLHALMGDAIADGYDLPRREGSVHITTSAGVMATNMTRVGDVDALDPAALTAAEIEGRRQAVEYARFLRDRVPGYERADLARLSHQIGVRESRRILGAYCLTRSDVLDARGFDDRIAKCGAPIEDHHAGKDTNWQYLPDGATYDIPYRCLLPHGVENLLVVGRCLSADHDAHASVRSMGQCMAMGQAGGIAAALSVQGDTTPRALSVARLQDRLRTTGAIIDAEQVKVEALS
ncbi:MAG: FAD-dependent oxidoreductase [Chloroflexota bacterium]|nr:FAD-dependent oxidoreductase [Chloroflexota bacterium]